MKKYAAYVVRIDYEDKPHWRVVYYDYSYPAGFEIFDNEQEAENSKNEWENHNG